MIDSIMFMLIGVLAGGLAGLAFVPLVHNRAVRLTTRRLKAVLPASEAEIRVQKDLLRAEFAISTRRLETTVEQLNNKLTKQLVELSQKSDVLNRLKIERDALKVELIAVKSQIETLKKHATAIGPRVKAGGEVITLMRPWRPRRVHY